MLEDTIELEKRKKTVPSKGGLLKRRENRASVGQSGMKISRELRTVLLKLNQPSAVSKSKLFRRGPNNCSWATHTVQKTKIKSCPQELLQMQDHLIQLCQDDTVIPPESGLSQSVLSTDNYQKTTRSATPIVILNRNSTQEEGLKRFRRRNSSTFYSKGRSYATTTMYEHTQTVVASHRSRSKLLTGRRRKSKKPQVPLVESNIIRVNETNNQWSPASSMMQTIGCYDISTIIKQQLEASSPTVETAVSTKHALIVDLSSPNQDQMINFKENPSP